MADERAGDWLLGAPVAAGALGEVREAASPSGARAVVKRLHPHSARDPALRALFAAECAVTCALPPHPHVVRGLGSDADADPPWLALARVDGSDLRTMFELGLFARLAQGGADARTGPATAIVAAAAEGAAHLHAHGWVHGDLVPQNLIATGTGVVLCDLGVARRIGEGGPVRGTAAYMAPEQVRGEPWTPAVDTFALGVVLWELATGERLFHRGQAFLSQAAVIEHEPPPLPVPRLAPLAAAALAKDPAARPTAAALAAALYDLL